MYSAAIRSRSKLIPATVLSALAVIWTTPAVGQTDPRFAADRFEPAARGSEWFANESLRWTGPMPFRVGVVSSYAERLFVVRDEAGNYLGAPLRNDQVLHVGAAVTPLDYLRLSADLPVHLITAGRTTRGVPAAPNEQGLGDLRFGADVRLHGQDQSPLRVAVGAQFWAPIGQQEQWASDGTWRVRPRAMVAGNSGFIVWSAQIGVGFRDPRVGSDIGLSGSVGMKLHDQFVVGPEFVTSTNVTKGAFEKETTPFEVLFGAHWLAFRTLRIGFGIGQGFTNASSDPTYRILGGLEYAPEVDTRPRRAPTRRTPPPVPPPVIVDTDHDGIPDDRDGCPSIAGIMAADASQNGCPPDTDGDNINDLGDACPTQPGPATDDPATTGCPPP